MRTRLMLEVGGFTKLEPCSRPTRTLYVGRCLRDGDGVVGDHMTRGTSVRVVPGRRLSR